MTTITKVKNLTNQTEAKPAEMLTATEKKTKSQKKKIGFFDSIGTKLKAAVIGVSLATSPAHKENTAPEVKSEIPLKSHLQADLPESHQVNMVLAQKGDAYLKKEVQLCETNPSRNLIKVEFGDILNRIKDMRSTYPKDLSSFATAHEVGNTCLKYSLGNCFELSCAGWIYLQTQENLCGKVDIFIIRNKNPDNEIGGDHAFIVIGRGMNSDPKNPSTWGNHAVVWDPLRNTYFQSTQIHLLQDYIGMDDQLRPISKSFDPSTQELVLYASNVYTSLDIVNLCDGVANLMLIEQSELKVLETCLNRLHSTTDPKRKKEMTLSLIDWLGSSQEEDPTPLFIEAKRTLIDQLNSTLMA